MVKRFIVDLHRRSLWQVLGIYVVGSWGALQVVDGITNSAGLPDWVPGFALVLLIIGLPIVLATAFVQEGLPGSAPPATKRAAGADDPASHGAPMPAHNIAAGTGSLDRPSSRPSAGRRLFTWRNAVLGGVAAFTLLGLAVAGYFVMRVTGIGPAASLAAQGVFVEREPIVLADFRNATSDSTLGRMVTEALRVDLVQSTAVMLLPPTWLSEALQRTGRTPGTPLTPEVARDLAIRGGVKAVIEGDIGAVGVGYVLTASIVDPNTGSAMAAFREIAPADADLLAAIDRLSNRIREKAGESLRSIRSGEPLSAVTTTSLDALRAYTHAMELYATGDRLQGIRMLEQAIELDPDFAMAHRRLSAELFNMGLDVKRMRAAATRAYELRGRLTRPEALMAEGSYHMNVTGDVSAAIAAYRELLRNYPDDPGGLNNLANQLTRSRAEATEAVDVLTRAINGPGATFSAFNNILVTLSELQRDNEIEPILAAAVERYPSNYYAARLPAIKLAAERRFAEAHDTLEAVRDKFAASTPAAFHSQLHLAAHDVARGRLREAREHTRASLRVAQDAGLTAWAANARLQLATTELLVARAPQRALPLLREIETDAAFDQLDPITLANVGITAWLAGDPALGARAAAALDAMAPADERDRNHASMIELLAWAAALASGDGRGALDAVDRFERAYYRTCDGRRCFGAFERAQAFEILGKTQDAIAAYEEHMSGLPFGSVIDEALFTPFAMERLANLYEQQGDVAKAIEYYARFAELWKDADAELQPRVRSASQRAARLLAAQG